jgi:hypothetical protein
LKKPSPLRRAEFLLILLLQTPEKFFKQALTPIRRRVLLHSRLGPEPEIG